MRINPEGYEGIKINTAIFLLIIAVVTATALVYDWAWWVIVLVDAFLLWRIIFFFYFFREPKRALLQEKDTVFAPADGKVVAIEEVAAPEGMGCERCVQMSVYMNFYDVHINWHPISGEVVHKEHFNGDFILAWHPKSSSLNEHTTVAVRTEGGKVVVWRQIAGWIARRIVCYPEVGDRVEQNTKLGCIKFGSRVDVFLPIGSEILVAVGDRVVGSQTRLARLSKGE